MAKPRPGQKREPDAGGQLPLPAPPAKPAAPASPRILPMQFQVGDRLTEATGEWEIAGRPYTTNQGKNVHVRVRRIDQPDVTDVRSWGAHERIAVRRG